MIQRLSIGRSLRVTLVGLTLVLALLAALGLSRLYSARQRYDDVLAQSSRASSAAAALAAAGAQERALLDLPAGTVPAATLRSLALAYDALARTGQISARSDPPSLRLFAAQIGSEHAFRTAARDHRVARATVLSVERRQAALSQALAARQQSRQSAARTRARADSRRALILIAVAALLALVAALGLVSALVTRMRRPLSELVKASEALAGAELGRRVVPSGPEELQVLGRAFNTMAEALAGAQERVEAERRRLALTISSLGDALLVTEPGSEVIATVNPRAQELVGELAPGTRSDDEASPLPPLARALRGEVVIEHGGRSLAVTAALLGGDETEHDGIVWTVRDITDRVRLERAKSEFVATASHELRSPLTSIKGFVELLARSSENMTDRQREFIDIVLRSTDRLVELVGDLLDVARIEADRVELDRRPIDVGEALRETVALMRPRLEAKRQHVDVYVAPNLPLTLADAGRVRQIVANLLTNAHLYTPEGGRLHVGAEPDRAWVALTVADTGVGMSEDELQHVFERFYRSPDRARSTAGTGLGLSIVKSLVEMHRGHIEVESVPGAGTTFRVLLPSALPGIESVHALEAIRGRRVLIVDDERDVAELIAGQLAPLEVEAEIVTQGEEAIEALLTGRFDAMTLDILMPGIDGFEVLRRVRSDPRLRMTPIVFVSVFSGRQELAGEWAVSKPIDADELRSVLGTAVRAGRSRVLVVGREELAPMLEPALDDLGIEHQWETSGAAAARVCGELRFELALIDVGIRNPQAVLQALDLRGRRLRQAVILFTDGAAPTPPGIDRLGMEVVPVEQAAGALLAALRGDEEAEDPEP